MIFSALVKKVALGPRQMTFGFDLRSDDYPDTVFSFIEKAYQAGGPLELADLVASPVLSDEMRALETLQAVFWLAEELKIHFHIQGRTFSPLLTKQMLMNDPDTPVDVVINKPADLHEFEQALKIGRTVLPALPEDPDQYQFSRYLVNELKKWKSRLASFSSQADQPFFPGRKEIRNGTILLDKILENQDSYSVIQALLHYRFKIVQLAETISILTRFYIDHGRFWQSFIDQMQAFETSLPEIKKDKQISAAYGRLSEILESSHPYPLVPEAQTLLAGVREFHQAVEREKMEMLRSNALLKAEKMISKMIGLFDTFESDQDYRNHSLQELRKLRKRMEASEHIEEINSLLDDAKDLFVDVIEEI